MTGMAKVTLIGNVGNCDGLKYLPSGKAVLNWSLAVNTSYTQGGEKVERTDWYRCALFGTRAEALAEYIVKGKQVYVEGGLTTRKYDGKNGVEISLDVDVREIVLLGSKSNGEIGAPKADGGDTPW